MPNNFTYPPFAALAFLPLTFVGEALARDTWLVLSCVALILTVWRCLRVLGYQRDRPTMLLCIGLSLLAVQVDAVRGSVDRGVLHDAEQPRTRARRRPAQIILDQR
ncbi:glycosyltransferase 87 family protein [Nocardia vinacea]|uniref:glycosyltransferase 87 family protein n=1 Tax=Nocardia vinacea TaxID=96468 RepID=UPI0033C2F358